MEEKGSGVVFETERLSFERLGEKHIEDFYELWATPEAVIWSSRDIITDLEETREHLANILPNDINPDIDKFAVILKGETNERGGEKCIGLVGTNRWSDQGMETGYCMNIRYWGKGYATEAFRAFLREFWQFEERKNIQRLVAKVSPGNVASQKVIAKCGGKEGEVLEKAYSRFLDGGVKTDIHCWYFDRPEEKELEGAQIAVKEVEA